MTVDQFVAVIQSQGWRVRHQAGKWRAQCPAHGKKDESDLNLSIEAGANGGIVCKCFSSGCKTETVAEALGVPMRELMPPPAMNGAARVSLDTPAARYRYTDVTGNLLFEVWRYAPKTFRPHHLDAEGKWVRGLPESIPRVLYRLPQLLSADPREPVFLCNGEKAVERLLKLGLVATVNVGGESTRWRNRPEWCEPLKGRFVCILQDNDAAGVEHGKEVREALTIAGVRSKILLLPGLPEKGDVVDWLEAGGTVEELRNLGKPPPSAMAAKVLSARQLLSADLPSADWIVPGMVAQRMVQLIAGREKTGKSVLVETLCMAVAAGGIWLGERCRPTRCLFINWEDPLQITQGRLRKHLAPDEEPPENYFVYPPPYTTSIWDLMPDLKALIDELELGLVIIDPIARAAKWKDENDASETARIFEALQELADATGCAFVPVHHANKSEGQFGDVLRGSTAIPAGVIGFSILRRTKERREFEFETIHKLSMGDDVTRILVRDRETMTWKLLRTVDHSEEGDEEVEQQYQHHREINQLLAVIEDHQGSHGVTQGQLEDVLQWSHAKIVRRLQECQAQGLVTKETPPAEGKFRPAVRYWLHPRARTEGG
jgi:hypothetical protein